MNTNLKLAVITFFLLITFYLAKQFAVETADGDVYRNCVKAVELTKKWFNIIEEEKEKLGIINNYPKLEYGALIGDEYTEFTTTLGSIEAKELSANPNFAGVAAEKLQSLGIGSNSKIGLTISGSFPALAISLLAAAQVLGCKVVLISSVGASMYGANQIDATWLDYENWLRNKGGMIYKSSIVTPGGEGDNALGMMDEGRDVIELSAKRNGAGFYHPGSLSESISHKTKILLDEKIDAFINIGGNQASLGSCSDNIKIPNGLLLNYQSCKHEERGIIARMTERNIPVIHILHIKNLFAKFGLPTVVTNNVKTDDYLFLKKKINYSLYFTILFANILLIVILRNRRSKVSD